MLKNKYGKAAIIFGMMFCAAVLNVIAEEAKPEHVSSTENLLFDRPLRVKKPQTNDSRFWKPCEAPALPEIAGIKNPLSQSFVRRYTTGGNKTWLKEALSRGAPYMAFIKSHIDELEFPPEFLYLPVIESAFKQNAVSSSGAAGLWQFMANSTAPWMKINAEIDERLDFWVSTKAALAKLKLNFDETADWAMALAAYNSGLGAIRRIKAQNPGKNYWELSETKALKVETLNYVPKLLAVYYIASNPRRMGFEDFWPETVEWVEIPLENRSDIRIIANLAALDFSSLRAVNAGLKFNTAPKGYNLKVRASDKEKVLAVLADAPVPLAQTYTHIIEKGDTVYAIARSYGVPVARILDENPGINVSALKIGAALLIPSM